MYFFQVWSLSKLQIYRLMKKRNALQHHVLARILRLCHVIFFCKFFSIFLAYAISDMSRVWERLFVIGRNMYRMTSFFVNFEESPNLAPEKRNEQYKGRDRWINKQSVLIGKGTLALRKRHEVNLGICWWLNWCEKDWTIFDNYLS